MLAAMLHQALLLGAMYELDRYGHITRRLFEHLNTRFYKCSAEHRFLATIYGEISQDARFQFLCAGQPPPAVFSRAHDRFMRADQVSFPPIGLLPSLGGIDHEATNSPLGFADHYQLNDWLLMGAGDILLLHTDGLSEHRRDEEAYFPLHAEHVVRQRKDQSARDIYEAIVADVLEFGAPSDDVSVVIIKRS
jgi:serine phosphatase RsbU (regulator of sigma subunit)